MDVQKLIGYHSTELKNVEPILNNGFIESKSKNEKVEWLGDGVYFWDGDYYAAQWNIINCENNVKHGCDKNLEDYAILKAVIKVEKKKIFDISSPEGSCIYRNLKNMLINKYEQTGEAEIINRLKDRSSKFWINILEDNNFFDEFDVLIAIYKNEKSEEKYKDDFILYAQKQICVKNKNCIVGIWQYDDQERIQSLYSLILKKRGKNYEQEKSIIEKSAKYS